ncbi:hypothetical protein WUBG_04407 [Wuchereria bancrofti]|uniref:Uncharacterized protein n=1 Tax=Wuchereria bancrofti TaxID=6293 RepID=J9F5B5_WUCBA|nr:hypothetical protein WUBG_04407 [Wuchereria bancrofti]
MPAVLSTTLIVTFALLTILIIVCLCWEKCFLHKIIRRKPTLDYIARPEETEQLNSLSLANEYSSERNVYEVNTDIANEFNKNPL